MKLVGIVANTHSPLAGEAIGALTNWLEERKVEFALDSDSAGAAGMASNLKRADIAREADLIVVLGGDGAIIGIARLIENRPAPILGVNLGSLGFLTEFSYEEMIPAMERVLAGDFRHEDRIMLDAIISRDGKDGGPQSALNDLVIHRGAMSQMVDIHVEADGKLVNSYTADGLIISTPTGSTAYNLSANGPIVYHSLNAFIISPICPHTLSNRPIVIPDNVEIGLTVSFRGGGEAVATLDGQVSFAFSARDKLTVRRSKEITRIIQSPFKNYYELLRGKLKWGEGIRDISTQ